MNYNKNRGDAGEIYDRYIKKISAIVGGTQKVNISIYKENEMIPSYWSGPGSPSVFYHGSYYVWLGDKYIPNSGCVIASFKLNQLDGCCGVCVSSTGNIINFSNKGLGTLLNQLRIEIARNMGYGLLLGTDTLSNQYQRKIFKKNGWRDAHLFRNPRTGNDVSVNVVDLWANPFASSGEVVKGE